MKLLWRIFLSTSIAITLLFAVVGWLLQDQFVRIASQNLEEEVRAGFQAYESLWRARADELATVSTVLSRMPDVRAAFSTGDRATIRDTAGEVWDQVGKPGALFLIADPRGNILAQAGKQAQQVALKDAAFVRAAAKEFPKQAKGFVLIGDRLAEMVVTPVYVAGGQGTVLLNVLVAGIPVDADFAADLKASTGGSDFVFLAGGKVISTTFPAAAAAEIAAAPSLQGSLRVAGDRYYQFPSVLTDLENKPVAELRILRPFAAASGRIALLRARLAGLWFLAMLAGMGLTYLLARRLLRPVEVLDHAASQIAKGNYNVSVPMESKDEFGRLAETFNGMCASIRSGREELIRQERLSTIGRLSTSIVHDLRNPLAAIYGGAEMLMDSDLTRDQERRLASNIYRSSRQIQNLLQELGDVSQGRSHAREVCRLREVVSAAAESLAPAAESNHVEIHLDVPGDVEIPLDRSPMERVFQNLIGNAIDAMPSGGVVHVRVEHAGEIVIATVEDTGPGIPTEITSRLFEPFVTAGKKNGMGLGLALARKTVVAHGGELISEHKAGGARFVLRLPV